MTNKQIDRLLQWYCDDRRHAEVRQIQNKERFMAEAGRIVAEHAQKGARPATRKRRSHLPKLDQ